mmetsp:Transcript_19381/g.25006  ORF Transcript_19381/g.25006 Transcript_19381/m.25006 type:complete len:158 (-) Transcript_19381:10-483(-)|eukprot:CAMPEP_0198142582 /NCGR_PEP_ID=MMETSP1443-20131203/5341_1 /TAXON_ID=186043 /ORGANISM="Entomoneis sp., Strain CCMP2396" /LENGTH=157 /DNA_ID=CAMNT_0043805629 /DNA_START=64 /DNA_END=537 /DNA_ORIENTATION=+
MPINVSYSTLMPVVDSWELVKRKSNWQENFGDVLFRKLFEKAPLSLTLLFPFGTEGEMMYESQAFKEAARESASVVDFIVNSMSGDLDMVQMQLTEIADEHKGFGGVRREHWVILGKALLAALEESLEKSFDEDTKHCWASAFDTVSTMMIEEMESR